MSNQKLQTADLFLVNRGADSHTSTYSDVKGNVLDSHIIQSPTEPNLTTYPDLTAGTIWVDTNQVPPTIFVWNGTSWNQIEGGGGTIDPDPITDIEILPAPQGGSGTQGDPFILSQVTCFAAGGTVQTLEEITIKNQPPLAPFNVEVLAGDARFSQPVNVTDSQGEWSGHFTYRDVPESTAGDNYSGTLKIGESSVYFMWTVTQVANQTPIVGGDGSTSAPNASPPGTDIDCENLYGTGTASWADGDGTLRVLATNLPGDNNSIEFGVGNGPIDQTSKPITAGQTIKVQFDASIVNAASDGDVISGALTNDVGFYQEWQMTKKTSAFAFQIAPLVDQELNAVVTTGAQAITGINAPATVDIDGTETLTSVDVSVAGAPFVNTFPVAFNPGDTLQARGNTGGDNDTEYTATFDIGGTTSTWSVTTTDVAASIPQPTIILPIDGATDLGTDGIELVSDDYQDNGTGAGAHASSTWEVYESDIELTPQTSAVNGVSEIAGGSASLSSALSVSTGEPLKDGHTFDELFLPDSDPNRVSWIYTQDRASTDGKDQGRYFVIDLTSLPLNVGDKIQVRIGNGGAWLDTGSGWYRTWGDGMDITPVVYDGAMTEIKVGWDDKMLGIGYYYINEDPGSANLEDIYEEEAFTTITLTNDKTYKNSDNSEIDGVTIDHSFKAGDKVIGEGNVVFADSPAFSTTTYTGDGGNKLLETGIDNTDKALIWFKHTNESNDHRLNDTVALKWTKGSNGKFLSTNTTQAPADSSAIQGYETNGVQVSGSNFVNGNGKDYVCWNFRGAPGFFDVVTFDGQSHVQNAVPHGLGSTPGAIIIKSTTMVEDWHVHHKDLGFTHYLKLNEVDKKIGNQQVVVSADANTFTVGNNEGVNKTDEEFVAYVFADTPGLIKCSSYSGNGSTQSINCGFKPGWLMVKCSSHTKGWYIVDAARGTDKTLEANNNGSESTYANTPTFTATGFDLGSLAAFNESGKDFIFIAIAEDAAAGEFFPTGVLTEDADKDGPTMTLKDVTGTWVDGLVAVNDTRTIPVPSPKEPISNDYTLVVNSVDDAVNLTEYPLTADDLNPGKAYHSRVKYKDDTAPTAIESVFSDWHWMSTSAAGGSYGNFSTTVYTGTNGSLTIDTGVDNTNKAMVWIKNRDKGPNDDHGHHIFDTERGIYYFLRSQTNGDQAYNNNTLEEFTSTGFKVGTSGRTSPSGDKTVAWNFAAGSGFFDVVTYAGGQSETHSHNLGMAPGAILFKSTSSGAAWAVYHKEAGADYFLELNENSAKQFNADMFRSTHPTDSEFTVEIGSGNVNRSGNDYVAYLFADNPNGGIKCGKFNGGGTLSNPIEVRCGFKAGWILYKQANGTEDWSIYDAERGLENDGLNQPYLIPNSSKAETASYKFWATDDGFAFDEDLGGSSAEYVFVAIADPN